jgi:hypothetical protein
MAYQPLGFGGVIYEDTGCAEVAPSCLACPLVACRYDDKHWATKLRHAQILADRASGMSGVAISQKRGFGIGMVYRAIKAQEVQRG